MSLTSYQTASTLPYKREPIFHGSHNNQTTSPKDIAVQLYDDFHTLSSLHSAFRLYFLASPVLFLSDLKLSSSLFKVVRPYNTPIRAIAVVSLICNVQFFKATLFRNILTKSTHQLRWLKSSQDSSNTKTQTL